MHLPDERARVGEPAPVEDERADAALPRVVDEHPAERDLRRPQACDVLEDLRRPVVDVAPLDQRELARRRHDRPAGVVLVRGERVGEVARVEVLVETVRLHAHLGPLRQCREEALRHVAEAAAAASGRAGKRERRHARRPDADTPAGRAREVRHGRVRTDVADLHRQHLPAQVDAGPALAAAEEVVAARGDERVVDLDHAARGVQAQRDVKAGRAPRQRHRRRATGLARRDPVDVAARREHLRERELVARRAHLVAEPRVLVLRDDRLAVLDERQPERVGVDLQREAVLGAARAACRQQAGERGRAGQPAHTSDHATSRSASRSPRDTARRRRASSSSVTVIAARRLDSSSS